MIISPDDYRYVSDLESDRLTYTFERDREPLVWGNAYLAFASNLVRMRRAIVLVGIPGSGKSTWATQQVGPVVIFDATSTTKKDRRVLVALAIASSASVESVFFDTSVVECQTRNALREEDRRVPDEVVAAMYERLEPPVTDEGFVTCTTISLPTP